MLSMLSINQLIILQFVSFNFIILVLNSFLYKIFFEALSSMLVHVFAGIAVEGLPAPGRSL